MVAHAQMLVAQNYKIPNYQVVVVVADSDTAHRLSQQVGDPRILFRTATTPQSIAGHHCPVLVDHRFYEILLFDLASLASRGLSMLTAGPQEIRDHAAEVKRLTGIVHSLEGHLG